MRDKLVQVRVYPDELATLKKIATEKNYSNLLSSMVRGLINENQGGKCLTD
jgi:hypothetical protein